ncbi:MAG: FeoA family protein [Bacteroidota bacterium]
MKLSQVKIGQSCVIESFTDEFLKLKLMEMGCIPGEIVQIVRVAPPGDPIAINVANYTLSMRKEEADTVIVKMFKVEN